MIEWAKNIYLKFNKTIFKVFWGKKYLFVKETKDFILILSIRSNGDHMNTRLLILHWIPISIPPSMECNFAVLRYAAKKSP